jgi:hypothetical protein
VRKDHMKKPRAPAILTTHFHSEGFMEELSESTEDILQKMTEHLVEISGKPFVAHDVMTKFRRSLLDNINQKN